MLVKEEDTTADRLELMLVEDTPSELEEVNTAPDGVVDTARVEEIIEDVEVALGVEVVLPNT